MNMQAQLSPLLNQLDSVRPTSGMNWQGWQIQPIAGGWNNLLYRAKSEWGDFAVKFCVKDARDRAGREFNSLGALQEVGLDVAPMPILLDRTSYRQPVVVQSWLEGEASQRIPENESEWQRWVDHLLAVHSVTPQRTTFQLFPGIINAATVAESIALIDEQLACIPESEQPAELRQLYQRLLKNDFPSWHTAPPVLCRVDCNLLNFVRQPNRWLSVDWENSGWGDPAFEIADLITHVANRDVPQERWQWLIDNYCARTDDAKLRLRIETHRKIRLIWYAARLFRYLYEMPRGLDRRLVALPDGWQADIQEKYENYLELSALDLSGKVL